MSPWDVCVTIAVHMGKNLLYTKFAEDMVMYILFGGGTFPAISGFIKYKIDLEKNMEYQWDTVTEEELKHLYYEEGMTDREIAERFGVSMGKVAYKRRKYGISVKNMVYQQFMDENSELFAQLNENSRERLLRRENIDAISKAVTHYAFRNGPVEDMHANGQLSQQDMKTLNKYMVNRIAGLLAAAMDGSWLQLEQLFSYYRFFGGDWDAAEPDMGEMKLLMERLKKR